MPVVRLHKSNRETRDQLYIALVENLPSLRDDVCLNWIFGKDSPSTYAHVYSSDDTPTETIQSVKAICETIVPVISRPIYRDDKLKIICYSRTQDLYDSVIRATLSNAIVHVGAYPRLLNGEEAPYLEVQVGTSGCHETAAHWAEKLSVICDVEIWRLDKMKFLPKQS